MNSATEPPYVVEAETEPLTTYQNIVSHLVCSVYVLLDKTEELLEHITKFNKQITSTVMLYLEH